MFDSTSVTLISTFILTNQLLLLMIRDHYHDAAHIAFLFFEKWLWSWDRPFTQNPHSARAQPLGHRAGSAILLLD